MIPRVPFREVSLRLEIARQIPVARGSHSLRFVRSFKGGFLGQVGFLPSTVFLHTTIMPCQVVVGKSAMTASLPHLLIGGLSQSHIEQPRDQVRLVTTRRHQNIEAGKADVIRRPSGG